MPQIFKSADASFSASVAAKVPAEDAHGAVADETALPAGPDEGEARRLHLLKHPAC